MIPRRHLRVRVLDALEQRAKQFRSREDLWPLRVPREPLSFDEVIGQALPDDPHAVDAASLRTRTLLTFGWDDGSRWEAWVIVLPSGFKLYGDTGEDETRILASGGRNAGDESDRTFLRLLAEGAGGHFGIELSGAAPSRVRSSIPDHEFLLEMLVELFEVSGMEDSVRSALARAGVTVPRDEAALGTDFRAEVDRWLDHALRAPEH